MIVYPYYTSNTNNGSNTWLTITNISPQYAVIVHLFFVDGVSCTQADMFICLTPNASTQLRASDFDPDIRKGWLLGVAVNQHGLPTQANFLVGNAFLLDNNANGFRYEGNYSAESFTAYSNYATAGKINAPTAAFNVVPAAAVSSDPACRYDSANAYTSLHGYNANGYVPGLYDNNGTTAALNFTGPPTFCYARDVNVTTGNPGPNGDIRTFQLNGGGYDFAPNRFTAEIQSPVDVPGQMIVTTGLSGDMNEATISGGQQIGTGVVINGNESPFGSFVNFILGRCQSMGTISSTEPRVPRGLSALIPAGNVATMAFNATAAVGVLMTPHGASQRSGIRALHKTNVNTAPVFSTVASAGGYQVVQNPVPAGGPRLNDAIRRYGVQLVIPVFIPQACSPLLPPPDRVLR